MNNISKYFSNAHVYTEKKGIYYVKITLFGEMHICGITVRESKKNPGDWWVQMPYYGTTFKKYIEFDRPSDIGELIEELCVEAVEKHITNNKYDAEDL